MNRREKLLVAGLTAAVVIGQGRTFLYNLVLKPIDDRKARIAVLEKAVEAKQDQELQLLRATAKLKGWSLRSLPPDPLIATGLYQNWLIQQASKHLTNVSVTPGRVDPAAKAGAYFGIGASIRGTGTLKDICDFLYDFHQADLLQRAVSIQVQSQSNSGDPKLDVTIGVEGLALVNSPARTTLMAADKPKVTETIGPPRSEYAALTARNVFVRGKQGTATAPENTTTDPSEGYTLVGVVDHDGQREGWLYHGTSRNQQILRIGEEVTVAGKSLKVLAFGIDYVDVEIANRKYRLELGRTLKQLLDLPETSTAAPEKNSPL
ncbi:MAG TPA: hypothetical protein VHB77_07390 [Planctomycetaceae bacterium]|nr:hypothetical protein [Planctomycetaceae bacterium]